MNNFLFFAGLLLVAVLILVLAALVVRILIGILAAFVEHRRNLARCAAHPLGDLGDFSSTDQELWLGEVDGIDVIIVTTGGPPTDLHADRVRAASRELPLFAQQAQAFLERRFAADGHPAESGTLRPIGFTLEVDGHIEISLMSCDDLDDWLYTVVFRNGEPVEVVYDH